MSEIWKTATLSEFVKEFIVPQRDKPTTFGGDIPWCRIEDFEGPYLSASKSGKCVTTKSVTEMPLRVFPTNTVLVSCSANLGKCAITTRPLVTNQTFIGLVPKDDVDSKFLYYLMGSKSTLLNEMATGVTIRYLSREKFSNLLVSIPSLPEQQRIVRLLDEAFEGITVAKANAEKNLHNARALFESVLQATFRQHGAGWNTASLADSCEMYQPKTISKSELLADGAYLVYGANGVIGRYNQFNHEEPQLLITCRGATCGAVNISQPFSWITGNAMVVRPKMESLEVRFLEYVFRGGIDVASAITGTAQPQITRASLSPLVFSYPTSPNEQLQIVAKLDGLTQYVEELEFLFTRKSDALKELAQTILHQALTGSLKVA